MIEEERVRSEFLSIRREYFPRWKAGETWTVHLGFRSGETAEDGYCDLQARRLYVSRQRTELNLRLVLVHECCHAVTSGSHQTKWRSRMAIAASTADKLGDAELATRLREEVEGYRRALREGATAIYATI